MGRLFDFLFLLLSMLSEIINEGNAANPQVDPPCGPIIGKHMKLPNGRKIAAFQGIPYSKPPVGVMRFQPPQPLDPWMEPLKAQKNSPRCVQPLLIDYSEDCLYMSIYTPTIKPSKPMPVLVYFYGGIFNFGATQDYGPDLLLQDTDVIFIVINSRGSLFGYLSFGDDVVPGNMGLKDCRLALQWIQTNIHSFGGDPGKVTIWGLSSGAVIVHSFLAQASDQGLFRAAITNSGTALTAFGFKSPMEVTKMKYSISELAKCPEDSEALLKCLQKKSALEILALYELAYHFFPVDGMNKFIPIIGPVMEPECVADRFVTGNPWDKKVTVPWLGGVTTKEALFFLFPAINDLTNIGFHVLEKKFNEWFPLLMNYQNSGGNGTRVVKAAREYYLHGKPIGRKTLTQSVDLLSDAYFVYGHYEAAKRSNTSQMFYYQFGYKGRHQLLPMIPSGRVGANHGDELYHFFRQPGLPFKLPRIDSEEDKRISQILIKMFMNFVIHLNPTPDDSLGLEWKPFSNDEAYLHFKQNSMVMENRFRPEQMEFWNSHPYPNRDEGDYENLPCKGYGKSYITTNSMDD